MKTSFLKLTFFLLIIAVYSILCGCARNANVLLYYGNPLPREKVSLLMPIQEHFIEIKLYWVRNDDTKRYYLPETLIGVHEIFPGNYTLGVGYSTMDKKIGETIELKFTPKPNKIYILDARAYEGRWKAAIFDVEDYIQNKSDSLFEYDKNYYKETADRYFQLERSTGIFRESNTVWVRDGMVYFK
jgi:hypothetical protein